MVDKNTQVRGCYSAAVAQSKVKDIWFTDVSVSDHWIGNIGMQPWITCGLGKATIMW